MWGYIWSKNFTPHTVVWPNQQDCDENDVLEEEKKTTIAVL